MIKVKIVVGCVFREGGWVDTNDYYFEREYSYIEEYPTIYEARKAIKKEYRIYDYEYSEDEQTAEFSVY